MPYTGLVSNRRIYRHTLSLRGIKATIEALFRLAERELGDGRPDIVGKPYQPERHIDVWFNEG